MYCPNCKKKIDSKFCHECGAKIVEMAVKATATGEIVAAGYVSGERYSLGNPRVLHKDYNPTNFDSSNLEWVESTDTRYIEYQKKVEEWKHQRNIELNPGRPLHPGW